MKQVLSIIASALPLASLASGPKGPPPEWPDHKIERAVSAYGSLNLGYLFSGYWDVLPKLTPDELNLMCDVFDGGRHASGTQSNALRFVGIKIKEFDEQGVRFERETVISRVVDHIKKTEAMEPTQDVPAPYGVVESGFRWMEGIRHDGLIKLSREWMDHEDSGIRETALAYFNSVKDLETVSRTSPKERTKETAAGGPRDFGGVTLSDDRRTLNQGVAWAALAVVLVAAGGWVLVKRKGASAEP